MIGDNRMANYHIFIASCFEGLGVQVPRIIKNIIEVGIPVEYVHIIVGGCPCDKIYYHNGIEIVQVMYRCFEFTPHIYIANCPNKYDFDFAFLTHDTVSFGKNFYNLTKEYIEYMRNNRYDTMRIDIQLPSMNIGIYSKKIIVKNRDKLSEITLYTNDKDELMILKRKLTSYEDFILNQNNYYNPNNISEHIVNVFEGINGVKSNGLIRNFKYIDFVKYQSNAYVIQSIDIAIIHDTNSI